MELNKTIKKKKRKPRFKTVCDIISDMEGRNFIRISIMSNGLMNSLIIDPEEFKRGLVIKNTEDMSLLFSRLKIYDWVSHFGQLQIKP